MSLNAKTFIFISSAVLVVSFSFISLSQAVEPAAAPVLPYPKATTSLVLSITVNTEPKGDFFVELDDGGQLFLTPQDLDTLKLNYAKDRTVLIRNERYVPLDAVLEVKHAFDENRLTLSFIGKTAAAEKTSVNIFSLDARPRNLYSPRELSAFLNYGLTYSYADPLGFQAFTASNKIGARAGDVFFVSDSLYTKTETSGHLVRLQSSATYERRGELQWVVLGDQFANSGEMGSSVNMGGIGFFKVYKLDPYFITQPVFDLKGSTIFPTQAEVYLDGVLIGRQAIAPGSFDLKNIYSYSGAHTVELVLKDPFGNEQRISSPVYFSSLLLRKGLHEYSYNAGFLREKYGIASNDYGKPAFSAFHRYGVTNSLNIGARAEGGDGVYDGGVSTQYLAPSFGAFSLSLAASDAKGTKGAAGSFQHSYQLGSFSTNVLLRGFSRDYATLGAPIISTGQTKYEASVGTGFLLMPAGSFSLGYSKSETHDGIDTRIASLNYSRSISKSTSFFASGSETRKLDATTRAFFVGLSFNFDRNLHGALQYNKTSGSDTVTAQIQKDVPVGEGIGYRAALSRTHTDQTASSTSFNPFFQYNARYGIYSLDSTIQSSSGKTSETYNLSVAGSFVYVGGFHGLSRPVSDSFGVVQVGNVPNATVLNNGQIIGTTNPSGFMVVPALSSYNLNRITVDTKNIPIDYSISSVAAARSPSLWSGSCIGFDAEKIQAVTGRLFAARGADREPVEFWEGTFRVGTERIPFLTGKGGEFYIENSLPLAKQEGGDPQSCRSVAERRARGGKAIRPGTYPASIDYQGRTCSFTISFPETGEVLTDLGEIVCGKPEEAPKPPAPAVPVATAAAAAPPVPAAEPAPSSAEDDPPRSIVVRLRADGSPACLTAKSGKAVSALVRFLARHPGSSIEIEGHADRHGSEEAAARLGRRAAEAVKDILIRSGVKAGRIRKVESLGRKKMICAEESAVCDGLNRRVVVRAAASLE